MATARRRSTGATPRPPSARPSLRSAFALLLLIFAAPAVGAVGEEAAEETPAPSVPPPAANGTAAPTFAPTSPKNNGTSTAAPTVSHSPTEAPASNSTTPAPTVSLTPTKAPTKHPTAVPTVAPTPASHNGTTPPTTPRTSPPTVAPHTPKPYVPPEEPTPAPAPPSPDAPGGGGRSLWQKLVHAVKWTVLVLVSAFAFAVCVSERARIGMCLGELYRNLRASGLRPYVDSCVRRIRSVPCPRLNLRGWSFSSLRRQRGGGMGGGVGATGGAYMRLGEDDFDDPNEGLLMGGHGDE